MSPANLRQRSMFYNGMLMRSGYVERLLYCCCLVRGPQCLLNEVNRLWGVFAAAIYTLCCVVLGAVCIGGL